MDLIQGDLFTHSLEQPLGVIGAFDVIEHLDDNRNSCAASGKLRPGGHLIITVPAHISLWCYFDEVAHHHRRYAPVEVECTLTAPGFTAVQATQFLARSFRPPGSSGACSASGGEPLASQRAATAGRGGV
jgi:2-polyprenyl-3-methyl-5-hydroxy-6-metoxy-1,4-benzoquinol methylase